MEVWHVIAHPDHRAAELALQPCGPPLGRPMMWMPYLMFCADCRGKPHHVQIPAKHARLAKPRKPAPPHVDYLDFLADFWKTIGRVIGAGIKNHLVALAGQLARQTDALPLTAAFHQQFMHD